MKKTLILLMCLLGKHVSAQYFQHLYGNATSNEYNAQFVPVSDANQGYMMVGGESFNAVHIVRSHNNASVPAAPYFNNVYSIADPNTSTPWPSWATSVAEINVGGGVFDYIVAGETINPTTTLPELLIMRINSSGAVSYVKSFLLSGYYLKDPKLKMALNGTDVLVTGRCTNGTAPQDVFIFNIDAGTGNANWGFAYDMQIAGVSQDDVGRDIIENPYAASAPEIIVVGRTGNDGLFLKVNASTGASIGATQYNISSSQELVSIKASANPGAPTADVFIVAGNVSAGPWNVWTMLIHQNGTIVWSTDHDSNNSGVVNTANEIMERLNSASVYEYYTIGTIAQSATNDDVQVLKLDNNGMLVTNGEFWYGTSSDQEKGMSIGFSNTGGFTASGHSTNAGGAYDQLLINAYFNGVTMCNYTISSFTSNTNTPSVSNPVVADLSSSSDYALIESTNTFGDTKICYSNSVASGNNSFSARIPKPDPFNFDIVFNGQSSNGSGSPLTLRLENNHSSDIDAYMTDMMGRRISCTLVYSGSGNNWQLTPAANVASGFYYIILSDGVERSVKTYLVK